MRDRPHEDFQALYRVEDLGHEYRRQHGFEPFNISYWNPSDQTEQFLLRYLNLPPPSFHIPYIYSHYEGKSAVLEQLGFTDGNRQCWFVNAGTVAVVLAVHWLAAQDITRLIVVCPAYFSVLHLCDAIKLPLGLAYMRRERGQWELPRGQMIEVLDESPTKTAFWITNPVFSTGCYLSEPDVAFLASLLERGAVLIADECLCINGYELSRALGSFDRFLGLYSPHKSVSVNATKFAAISFHKNYHDFFRGWGDVLTGPLASSTYSAIRHFLGEGFHEFQNVFLNHIDAVHKEVLSIVQERSTAIVTDEHAKGHYITCYIPLLPANLGKDERFMRDLIWQTAGTLVAGVRSHMTPDVGFSFRINLARSCPQFYSALRRITNYLLSVDVSSY
jgi:hypothetical protein